MVQMHLTREQVYTAGNRILQSESQESMEDTHQTPRALEIPIRIQQLAWAARTIQTTIPIRQACFLSR